MNCLSGAIYICTESVFPSKRLQNLLEESPIAKEHNLNGDLIFIEHISTVVSIKKNDIRIKTHEIIHYQSLNKFISYFIG